MPKKITAKSNKNKQPLLNGFSWLNIIAITVVIVLVGLFGFLVDNRNHNVAKERNEKIAGTQVIKYDGVDGKNALEILKKSANIRTEETVIGVFVSKINDVENDNQHYWMFYVNGDLANVSADQYQTKNTDKIEWRYEKIEY